MMSQSRSPNDCPAYRLFFLSVAFHKVDRDENSHEVYNSLLTSTVMQLVKSLNYPNSAFRYCFSLLFIFLFFIFLNEASEHEKNSPKNY